MTTDTSREAVEDLIAEGEATADRLQFARENVIRRMGHTLAALLDERDGALAGATTLPHEAAMAGTAGEFAARWNSYRPEKREQAWAGIRAGLDRGNACFTGMHDGRIRDLEAELHFERTGECPSCFGTGVIDSAEHRCGACNGRGYFPHAGIEENRRLVAERDRLAAKLDAVKAVVTGWNGFTGLTREVLAILDTSGCWWEFEDGDRKFLPHERADNGACANCFALLADTDEGNER